MVPDSFGKLMVLSAVGSTTPIVDSKVLATAPSNPMEEVETSKKKAEVSAALPPT